MRSTDTRMLITVVTFVVVAVAVAEIPPYIHVCGRRDPKLDACIIKKAIELKGKLAEGMPELEIPSMEPIKVDQIPLANSDSFKADVLSAKLYGLTEFQISEVHMDTVKQTLNIELFFEQLTAEATLKVAAAILVPIAGEGVLTGRTDNVVANVTMHYQFKKYNGKNHMYFPKMTTKLTVNDYHSHFVAKEGEDSPLATGINAALDNSRPEIIKQSVPHVESAISKIALDLVNKLCKHISYDELFPDSEYVDAV